MHPYTHTNVDADHKLSPVARRKLANDLSSRYMSQLRSYHGLAQQLHAASSRAAQMAFNGQLTLNDDSQNLVNRMNQCADVMITLDNVASAFGINLGEMARDRAGLWVRGDESLESVNASIIAIGGAPLTEAEDRERRPQFYSKVAARA